MTTTDLGALTLFPAQPSNPMLSPTLWMCTAHLHAHVECGCQHASPHIPVVWWALSHYSALYLLRQVFFLLNLELPPSVRLAASELRGLLSLPRVLGWLLMSAGGLSSGLFAHTVTNAVPPPWPRVFSAPWV